MAAQTSLKPLLTQTEMSTGVSSCFPSDYFWPLPGSTDPAKWLLPILFPLCAHLLALTKRNLAPAQATVPREAPTREDFGDLWVPLSHCTPDSFIIL